MISREQALQIALDHLTDGLRNRLEVSPGWPPEMPRAQTAEEADAALENVLDVIYPERSGRPKPEGQRTPECDRRESAPPPREIWRVYVPSEQPMCGASRYIIVDAQTGEVLADAHYGE